MEAKWRGEFGARRGVRVGRGDVREATIGGGGPLTIIAGPCVMESRALCEQVGAAMRDRCAELGFNYIFKASFDKANRSSLGSARGPGLEEGLAEMAKIRASLGVAVTTDVHEPGQAAMVAEVVDLLQVPAFLCRQTDLLVACAATGRPVNVKKGQFLSPNEMGSVVEKLVGGGGERGGGVVLTERGTFFGYNRLVNDFIGVVDMMDHGWPVCFDVTHSTQLPGGGFAGDGGGMRVTAGRVERAPMLARCAVVAGVDVLFLETHPDPAKGLSDAATMLPLEVALAVLGELAKLRDAMS